MTDSELHNDQIRIYIDTVTMSGLTSGGFAAFTTLLGGVIGSAVGGIGALAGLSAGFVVGILGSAVLGALYQYMV